MSRTVLVLTNPHRPATHEAGEVAIAALKEASVHVVTEFDRAQFEATGSTDIDAIDASIKWISLPCGGPNG